jgi:uncharacterized membrane protein YeaQ/YmgE (transglycosylase-associated protein family)
MSLGTLLGWVFCGLVVGLTARVLVPGAHKLSQVATVVLGVAGALVGGALYSLLNGGMPSASEYYSIDAWPSWMLAIVGAVLGPWAYLALARKEM